MAGEARSMLQELQRRHGRPITWGHSQVAHDRLGLCAMCVDSPAHDSRLGASVEVSGWRLLAMAEDEEKETVR